MGELNNFQWVQKATAMKGTKAYTEYSEAALWLQSNVIHSPPFERGMLACILISCTSILFVLAEESTTNLKEDDAACFSASFWTVLDAVCTTCLFCETAIRVVAEGVFRGKHAILKSKAKILDAIISITSFTALITSINCQATFAALCVFRLVRSLRPLRLFIRVESLRDILVGIYASLNEGFALVVVIICCKVAYSIVGQQMFMGTFGYCSDETFEGALRRARSGHG